MSHIKDYQSFNESKITRNVVKGALDIVMLIKGFKKLFNKVKRNKLLEDLKVGNKIIDLIMFLKESESWMTSGLTSEDIKKLAKNLKIEKKYPSEIDIFKSKYKEEFNRKLKDDLYIIEKSLKEDDYDGTNPKTISYLNNLIEMVSELKESIK